MNDIFIATNSILVHSFTELGGAGNSFSTGLSIYERIDNAITKNFEISASSIKEGDGMFAEKRNLFGSLSIILTDGKITYANETDGGTFVLEQGKREKDSDTIPDRIDIINAINNRNPYLYNEICIKNYKVIGFIICMDDSHFLTKNIISEECLHKKTKKHNLPYFFLYNGKLKVCEFDNKTKQFNFKYNVRFDDIYKDYNKV